MAKNYVKWSAKLVKTQFGDLINVTLNLEDLQRLPQYKWYVKLTIAARKEVGQYWDTHYIYENEYSPNNETKDEEVAPKKSSKASSMNDDELPF